MLVRSSEALYHVWAEAWINGVWVPVDTTVSRVGLPAGYVLAFRPGPEGAGDDAFARVMARPGVSLTLMSGGRETPGGRLVELVVGDRSTYAVYEGDWMANLFWGFALRLPAGWRGTAKLNAVELASPDGMANVKCEALPGNYRVGKEELAANVKNLKSNLNRFKTIEDKIVSFDAEGATQALFIDFTCVQDGNNLRCRQYIIPRRWRAFRISFWAPRDAFDRYVPHFESILASFEF
jgi:hypothetical protein